MITCRILLGLVLVRFRYANYCKNAMLLYITVYGPNDTFFFYFNFAECRNSGMDRFGEMEISCPISPNEINFMKTH